MRLFAKITNPDAGWPYDQDQIKKLQKEFGDDYIEVHEVQIGRSSTGVYFLDYKGRFNSVNFTFYINTHDGVKEYDVFKNERKLNQVYNTYLDMFAAKLK